MPAWVQAVDGPERPAEGDVALLFPAGDHGRADDVRYVAVRGPRRFALPVVPVVEVRLGPGVALDAAVRQRVAAHLAGEGLRRTFCDDARLWDGHGHLVAVWATEIVAHLPRGRSASSALSGAAIGQPPPSEIHAIGPRPERQHERRGTCGRRPSC